MDNSQNYIDTLNINGDIRQIRDSELRKDFAIKTYNLTMQGSEWITLAKVSDVLKNSSALFTITCYGVKDNVRSILTTSKFSLSCGLSDTKELITSVLPLSQVPEIQQGGDASGGSSTEGGSTQEVSEASAEPTSGGESGSGESGSGNSAIYGLNNIAFEKYDENTIYVMGLISFPATDKYDSLDVEMRLDDNLNFEYLESLDVVYKQEDDILQEGTQIYVKGDYVNYYMRDGLNLIQQYINSVGPYNSEIYGYVLYKREDGHLGQDMLMYKTGESDNKEYYICGITNVISEYFGLAKDYEKFRNQETISIPIQLGVEFNLFNILKEYIDDEVINDLGKGYKVELHKYYNPGGVTMDYNGLDEDYVFVIHTVGTSEFDNIDESNFELRNCDKNTPNYVINAYDSLGEYLEEGTIYLNVFMVPEFFIIDFIFNASNQFPNGKQLEITRVNVLPLRYMGGTKVENYSQSYELYNPYKRLDMLSDGNVIHSINMFSSEWDDYFAVGVNYKGFENGSLTSSGKSVQIPKQIVRVSFSGLDTDRQSMASGIMDIYRAHLTDDKYMNDNSLIPIFINSSFKYGFTNIETHSIINIFEIGINVNDTAKQYIKGNFLSIPKDNDENNMWLTKFEITFYSASTSIDDYKINTFKIYQPDITTDESGKKTIKSIGGIPIEVEETYSAFSINELIDSETDGDTEIRIVFETDDNTINGIKNKKNINLKLNLDGISDFFEGADLTENIECVFTLDLNANFIFAKYMSPADTYYTSNVYTFSINDNLWDVYFILEDSNNYLTLMVTQKVL